MKAFRLLLAKKVGQNKEANDTETNPDDTDPAFTSEVGAEPSMEHDNSTTAALSAPTVMGTRDEAMLSPEPSDTTTNDAAKADPRSGDDEAKAQRELFRSSFIVPGFLRDMNLIQDYSDESNCPLLQLLAGERQYFYLQPISLKYGLENTARLEKFVLTSNDLEILSEYITRHRRFGLDLSKSLRVLLSNHASLTSSKHIAWSTMQRPLADFHAILLAAHLVALHFHAVQMVGTNAGFETRQDGRDLLTSGTLSSDLFKFILRPIRSSAIESSLNDALPISLVRETIIHCPELVNHVLNWKDEDDVPSGILSDITALKDPGSAQSTYLNGVLAHLRKEFQDVDRVVEDIYCLCKTVKQITSRGGGQKLVLLVNQLKSVGGRVLARNTCIQLHKWATVFVENSFAWFDSFDGDDDSDGDRSYDKFTCLQDALNVWHNEKLYYSSSDVSELQTVNPPPTHSFVSGELDTSAGAVSDQPEFDYPPNSERVLTKVEELEQMTPPELLEEIKTWTQDQVSAHVLSGDQIEKARVDFNESLAVMRASMKIMGRTAPWRAHLKHSNILKREYRKQGAIENRLLLHEWAVYLKQTPHERRASAHSSAEVCSGEDQGMKPSASPDTASSGATDSGATSVFDHDDPPQVVELKTLRHEIETVAQKMQGATKDGETSERRELLEACNLLAASCVSALTKFINPEEPAVSSPSIRARQRANSTGRHESTSSTTTRSRSGSKTEVSLRASTRKKSDAGLRSTAEPVTTSNRAEATSDLTESSAKKSTHNLRPRSFSSPSRGKRPVHSGSRANTRSSTASRSSCSECDNSSRQCTSCSRCLSHCPCTNCDCRLCSATRTDEVQKTLSLLLSAVETRVGCKYVSLDSLSPTLSASDRCGMVKTCAMCQQCAAHCVCHRHGISAGFLNGFGATASSHGSRKERRFRIKPTATQRRAHAPHSLDEDDGLSESDRSSSPDKRAPEGATRSTRKRRSNSDVGGGAYHRNAKARVSDTTSSSDFFSSSDGTPFSSTDGNDGSTSHQTEQEDLFRAARVRMKLQRNVYKVPNLYGAIPPNTSLDGDILWQPERIRAMWERKDVYGVLGLPREATTQQIKRQYRKLVLKLHPDKATDASFGTSGVSSETSAPSKDDRVAAFVAVTQAYKLLSGEITTINNSFWKSS
ncbi:hypothetical protein PINS_up010306 [Pythium insidiosum]|nr:hypothetical protein PINS_up010306 [Pythium insidiosum]